MRSLYSLAWRNLWGHTLRSALTVLAIALGVAMVLAASIVGQAASKSASKVLDEGTPVDLEVFARDSSSRFAESIADSLQARPEIVNVSAELSVDVVAHVPDTIETTIVGVDPKGYVEIYQPELVNGTFLDGPDTIVLPMALAIQNGLNVGDEVTLAYGKCSTRLVVVGRLKVEQDLSAVDGAPAAYVPLETAQYLVGAPDQIDRVAVTLRPGVDVKQFRSNLSYQLGDDLVVVGAADEDSTFAILMVQISLGVVGLIMLAAAAFVIANAFAMSITARTREIGAMRALGMTRRQVMYVVLVEAVVLGLVGTLTGVPTGVGLAWVVMRIRDTLDSGFAIPWWGVAASTALGLSVTLIGALQPALRASRVLPLVALRTASEPQREGWYVRHGGRAGAVLLLVVLPAVILLALVLKPDFITAFAYMGAGMASALGGVVLLMPVLVQPVTSAARPLLIRWFGTAGRLAADNLTRSRLRTVLTAGALTVGLTTIVTSTALLTFAFKGGLNAFFGLFQEDLFVIPDIAGLLASGELSVESSMDIAYRTLDSALVRDLEQLDVGTLVYYGFAPVPTELSSYSGAPGVFVDPEVFLPLGNYDFFEGDVSSALEMMRGDQAVLVIPLLAERQRVEVGDTIAVGTARGPVEFTVAGIGGTSTCFTVFSYVDGQEHFDLGGPSWIGVVVHRGVGVEAALERMRELVAPFDDVVVFDMQDSGVGGLVKIIDQLQALLSALLLLAVVVASLGVVNTVVINVAERRREIALLRAVGATQRQVRQAVVAEAATLGVMAALIATAVGLVMLALTAFVGMPNGTSSLGVRMTWGSIWRSLLLALRDLGVAAALSLVLGPLVAGCAAYYPARQAAAMDVVEATCGQRVVLGRAKRVQRPSKTFGGGATFAWQMAWRSLSEHRARTALSVAAVVLGVAMIAATGVTSAGVRSGIADTVVEKIEFAAEMVGIGLSVAGVMILVAAGFLISNAFGMSVTQRRRRIGALRALGMTRRQILWMVLAEALIVGGIGTSLGVAAGPLLGRGILIAMRSAGYEVGRGSTSPIGVVVAVSIGMAVTLLAALLPAWRAMCVSPLVALRSEMTSAIECTPPARIVAGTAVLVVLAAYLAIAPPGRWTLDPWNYAMPFLLAIPWLGALLLIAPALIGGFGRVLRGPLSRLWHAVGSVVADNLRRGRRRVTLTALTFAVSIMSIVGITGVLSFFGKELIVHAHHARLESGLLPGWSVGAADFTQGVTNVGGMVAGLRDDVLADVYAVTEGRATVGVEYPVNIPEISAVLVPGYVSTMLDLNLLTVPGNVRFVKGDLETALPIMEAGCGVLLAPGAAARNGVSVGETLIVEGKNGPLECTVAGVVAFGMIPISAISPVVKDEFDVGAPTSIIVFPNEGVDREALEADLLAIDEKYGQDAWLFSLYESTETVLESTDRVLSLMSSLLLLAILAAALGVVNTTMMSVTERRQELGLFRAVGATRRQVVAAVWGEAALVGFVGGCLGVVGGSGVSVIFVLAHGGNAWGYPDIDLFSMAWRALQPALRNGLYGVLAAPVLSAIAAWFTVRALVRGSAIETMAPARQKPLSPRQAAARLLYRGSLRARFVVGTAVLTALLLLGLVAVVIAHARVRMEEQLLDMLHTMVSWNAGMIEMALPEDARTIELNAFAPGGSGINADALLRLEALLDDMTANGLVDFAVVDRDNVVLASLDLRDVGTVVAKLDTPEQNHAYSERDGRAWRMYAAAPIRSAQGQVVGSVRLTADAQQVTTFLTELRGALWGVGIAIACLGLSAGWVLSKPLTAPGKRAPSRIRLVIAMVAVVVLVVAVLGSVAIPIERRHVEDMLRNGLMSATEWVGQVISDSLEQGDDVLPVLSITDLDVETLMTEVQAIDPAKLQVLLQQVDLGVVAYSALVDDRGVVVLSDQLGLIGEHVGVPPETHVEERTWRGKEVWVTTTPLRMGRKGEQIGALQTAIRRERVETFLDESRNLFRLTGVIAVLVGVLLAQLIGGVVAVPAQQLAVGAQKVVTEGHDRVLDTRTRDELALLTSAFDQMTVGLREREWLRDMFGRFVSKEVAEAIRSGQVRLEGENRVVSVLFCDIRGFTARSERYTPEQIVALLNEYLSLVIEAAQRHGGVVSKFGGDSTLVVYGAPKRLQESAYQAVLTALDLRARLEWLNEVLAQRGEPPLRIGTGVNTGLALAGAVGPQERQEYAVIGDAVNLASRIEALNKSYPEHDLLISGHTYDALGRHRAELEFVDLGDVMLGNGGMSTRIWSVVGLRRSASNMETGGEK
jgi:putative ABC transport system permease protein